MSVPKLKLLLNFWVRRWSWHDWLRSTANVSPHGCLEVGSAAGLASRVGGANTWVRRQKSKVREWGWVPRWGRSLERQASGQGRGQRRAEAGVRQRRRVRRRGLASARVGEARACAQASQGGAARARGAWALEGGVQAGAGRGRGRGGSGVRRSLRQPTRCWLLRVRRQGRQGCDPWLLASPAVFGSVGRWASRSWAAAEETAQPPQGESVAPGGGWRGSPGQCRGGASLCDSPGRGRGLVTQVQAPRLRQ